MSAKTVIQEILGAVNFWVDRNGKPYQVSSHLDFGAKTTGLKPGAGPGPSVEDGRIYQEMFRRGWLRVSIMNAANEFMVDFRGQLSRAQLAWIEDEAADRQMRVVDDQGRQMMDFTRESVAVRAVNRLLENDDVDPKEFALKNVKLANLGTRGWVHCDGSETPVQKYLPGEDAHWHPDGGWEFSDANYDMADKGDELYGRWYSEVLQALNRGEESGVAAGYKWHYKRDRKRERQDAQWATEERRVRESIGPEEAKDIIDKLFRDGEYLGVYVTRDEDTSFITDRFGEVEDPTQLSRADADAIERLQPFMIPEVTWIAKRQGVYGIYAEKPYHNLDRPDDQLATERENAVADWVRTHGRAPANGDEASQMLVQTAKEIGEKVPGSVVYIYVGDNSMLGIDIRIFLPNPTQQSIAALALEA